tara:strand:+ start:98 stop:382 length:285 start_codon:yes stop_codon:yes gene_type:complete
MSSNSDISILIQLIQLAQKRGTYSLDESYLAFSIISKYVNDSKYTQIINLVNSLDNKVDDLNNTLPHANLNNLTTNDVTNNDTIPEKTVIKDSI